ncbi:MAG: hypothetical protein D6706_21230 [Chloroflexi bacterium]|nr:MAG: hypothetical protein D6706_21230 [Chloroflexota bacterium]
MSDMGPGWIGRLINGRYKIESLLGTGGMSSVYKAFDPNLQRHVAIKIIHPHLTKQGDFIERFRQEATAVAQLRHPNIVQVYDFDISDDIYYMVMEYIPGQTLAQRLKELNAAHLRLPLNESLHILITICDAIDYAHQRRMIHRDIKPANVILNLLGEPILTDFGIAKIIGGNIQTMSGAAIGTAPYMSPEQVRGQPVDYRSDIYALGIMLYELISGEPPFTGDSTYEIMMKHVNEPVPDISKVETNTPPSIVSIIETALAKSPDNRFQSAAEMASALRTAALRMQSPTDTLAARHLERLSTLWQQARDRFDERDLAGCLKLLEQLKRLDEDYQREKVQQLWGESLQRLFARAKRELQANKFEESLTALTTLRQFHPDYPGLNELESQVRQQMSDHALLEKLNGLYDEAVALLNNRNYEAALAKWETIEHQREHLDFPDRLQVKKRAIEGMCGLLYGDAIAALAEKKPYLALDLWSKIREIDPDFPDRQNVVQRAEGQLARRKSWIIGGSITAVSLVILALGFFILRDNTPPPLIISPTPTTLLVAAIQSTDTPTPTSLPTSTNTPTPTLTNTPTTFPTSSPTVTLTATPAPTATPSPSPTATNTPLPQNEAIAQLSSSIFVRPDSSSQELDFIAVGESVEVLGRSPVGTWFYVRNKDGVTGYVFAPRMIWEGDFESLPVIQPPNSESSGNSDSSVPLGLDIWTLPDLARCEGSVWFQTVYMHGQGGNGRYTYYWENEYKGGPTNESITFEVSARNNNTVIGTGKVTSDDGQTITKPLFIPPPACANN